jgi:CubicO group peptidase (beta-lactamase class C family)
MSIAKVGVASVIGSLLCEKKIKLLTDIARIYSNFLKNTPYANITIKNILLMSSGVSKPGDGEGRFIATALGFGKLAGKGSVKNALNLLGEADTSQGERFNYHPSDPLALSILVQEITNKPLGQLFYENIYLDFRKEGRLHCLSDNEGVTVPIPSSAMRARDWASFGQYIMQQMSTNTCLGKFFK